MTPEQLRASILQQAMEGKLVKQDPNDEPASELLEKIKAEKEQLVKAKKIKKTKALPKITEDEKPFDIPENWEWVRLGTVFNLQAGKNRKASTINEIKTVDYDYPCFGGNGIRGYVSDFNREGKYALIGRQGALCGNINFAKGKFYATEHAVVVEIFAGTNYKWSGYFLKALNLNQYSTATAQPGLSVTKINRVLIPLPPLKEQLRIVAKIEKLMPLIDEYAKAYNRLKAIDDDFNDKMKQSILQYAMEGKLVKQDPDDEPASELLKKIKDEKKQLVKEKKIKRSKSLPRISEDEKLFDIPENWEWVRLTEVGSWGAGATPSRSHPEYYNGGIPWLKTGDLNDGVISSTSETISQAGADNSSVRFNQPGNILIAMYGATIGKLGIAGISLTTNQACCGCKTFDGIYNWYLFYYLLAMRPLLIDQGSGGAQPNISKTKIEKFPFALPPFEEQKRIVTKIEKLMPLLVE
ncbi:restriction endonuclease subunit S [Limosilactobacillus reuteri]|uniref:restriction endonuclease subunit S n=1 Tax=Limosilactobacillus reuteri TaxID=1598 RepID=UPI001E64CB65|nr:restriction endonuclease subunit S [Limosilactobacillus reuteri]UFK65622.1 hypothetical protein IU404_01008 [Limosilactobacillus reuteri]UFK68361.1 hypothetical protein IVR12_01415 [Limosilactobacillus reuteri]